MWSSSDRWCSKRWNHAPRRVSADRESLSTGYFCGSSCASVSPVDSPQSARIPPNTAAHRLRRRVQCFQMQYVPRNPVKSVTASPKKPDILRPIAEVFGSSIVFMARKTTSTLPEEEFEAAVESRASARSFDESPLDARMLDLDDEGESPFLRGQKRVPVRRGALPRKA